MASRFARTARWPAAILAALATAWMSGLVWFAQAIPPAVPENAESADAPTDAIVVLTGGSSRVRVGLSLLAAGAGRKLLVSGVYRGVDVADLLRAARQVPSALECCITLGYEADNTAGNAAEARGWINNEGFGSIRLVTANYHMPRSLLEFRRAMPGVTIVPHPVEPDNFAREAWWRQRSALALVASEYDKFLLAAMRPALAVLWPGIENS